jgi:hypothetical protein
MSIKDTSVCNTDLLQSAKFILSFPRLTSTQFFCQTVNIPDISTQNTLQNTPFSDLNIPGDKLVYGQFNMEFLIDEELQSWIAVHDWMRGIAFPTEFQEYENLKHLSKYSENVPYPQYADAELTILAANNTPKLKVHFIDMFPIALSQIVLDIRLGSEHTITSSASFKFKRYDIIKI